MSTTVPRFFGVAGLPRAGSTLVCQILGQHPDIDWNGQSSPLCNSLLNIRRSISDDEFFLAQLDRGFDGAYERLTAAMKGYLRGWCGGGDKAVVIDKNRAWLQCIELLLTLAPEAKLVICLRDPVQIYGSVEAKHQKTILVDFADHLADYDRLGRADMLFAKDKVIGAPMVSIAAIQDLPDVVKEKIMFIKFEDVMANPQRLAAELYAWAGVAAHTIDPQHLSVPITESDSYYRMKFTHRLTSSIEAPKLHDVPKRIKDLIHAAYPWFYQLYYPGQ
jgi:sulfotransferase